MHNRHRILVLFSFLSAAVGCSHPQPAPSPVTAQPAAKQTAVKYRLVEAGTNLSPGKETAVYRWEVQNASDLRVSFAGQTLHLTAIHGPASVTVQFRPGLSKGQITTDLSAHSGGSDSTTAVSVGTDAKDLRNLIRCEPAQGDLPPGKLTEVAKGLNAFPSVYLQAGA